MYNILQKYYFVGEEDKAKFGSRQSKEVQVDSTNLEMIVGPTDRSNFNYSNQPIVNSRRTSAKCITSKAH